MRERTGLRGRKARPEQSGQVNEGAPYGTFPRRRLKAVSPAQTAAGPALAAVIQYSVYLLHQVRDGPHVIFADGERNLAVTKQARADIVVVDIDPET